MKSLSLTKPHLLLTVGVPGSGKSFFAEKFAETFRAPHASLEKITDLAQNIDQKAAEAVLRQQIDELLKTQQSIIVEGGTDTRAARQEFAKKARAAGYETLIIWVQTDPVTAKDRATRPAKSSTYHALDPEEYDRQTKHFSPPVAIERPVVISGKHTYATQAKVVLKRLSGPRAEISTHTAAPIRPEQPGRRNITIR